MSGSTCFLRGPDTDEFNLHIMWTLQRFGSIGRASREDPDCNLFRLLRSRNPVNKPCLPRRDTVPRVHNLHRLTDFIFLGECYDLPSAHLETSEGRAWSNTYIQPELSGL